MSPVKQEKQPPRREIDEVARGVLRVQLPVWMPGLGHVNMYVLEDDRGAAVVDPGLPGSWRALRKGLKRAGIPWRRVHTIVVTHSHPDHFGGATRLMRHTGAELVTHDSFRVWWKPPIRADLLHHQGSSSSYAQVLAGDVPWKTPGEGTPFRRSHRLALGLVAARTATPRPTRTIDDGRPLTLGGREWTALHTPGHTRDHICLFEPDDGTLLTGDHVLPTITPHVSGLGFEGGDPLGMYLDSLHRTRELPGVRTVLPAHGDVFSDLPGRVDEIEQHHRARLDRIAAASRALGPATVTDLSHEVFPRRRWGFMSESETYAHLEHLRLTGRADRRDEPDRILYTVDRTHRQ